MERLRLATVWLGGCSGCHMSFLDLDEWLIDLAAVADVVYTPVMDVKEYPENVDAVLVEGAVANEDNLEMLLKVRERSKVLISFGDCAVTGNVTALRNPLGTALPVLERGYVELADLTPQVPSDPGVVPRLLDRVVPLHKVVNVDAYMPGCPPPADRIRRTLEQVLAGKPPHLEGADIMFGSGRTMGGA
jgi:NAD-reducing hydrogenase small subunit